MVQGESEKKNANAGSSLRPIHARYNVEQSRQFPSAISITRFPVPGTQFPPISHKHGAPLELSVGLPDELPSRKKRSQKAGIASLGASPPGTRHTHEMAAAQCLGRCL
ncbi:hypothetical protein LI328DRAFT_130667 [Trichoderma asperelloides]|nr:hypothetical protein LI328DRAFT_130667 [Trichoderma asperelloides]